MRNKLSRIFTLEPWVILLSTMVYSISSELVIGHTLRIIWLVFFTYWTLGVGEKLYNKLEDKSILNLKRFKIQVTFVLVYLFIVIFSFEGYEINNENFEEWGWKARLIIPLHLIIMYFMIHTMYFLSKCISVLRKNKEGFGWYILGFWFFPIGLWIIQPRIIELIEDDKDKKGIA